MKDKFVGVWSVDFKVTEEFTKEELKKRHTRLIKARIKKYYKFLSFHK